MLSKTLLLLLFLKVLAYTEVAGSRNFCLAGRALGKKYSQDGCWPCAEGTFISKALHNYTQCFPCTQIQNPDLEILVSKCNATKDTEIHCIEGFFRIQPAYPGDKGHCQRCSDCPFSKTPCQKFRDVLCCPDEDYAVRVNKEGVPICVRVCGAGQLLDPDKNQCLPCPANTFMKEERHTHIYCWNCNIARHDNEVVIQPCIATNPGEIGCKKGCHYRSSLIYPFQRCAKCQVCSENTSGLEYEARGCENFKDTVCCPHPNMLVVDTPEGPKCLHPVTAESTPSLVEINLKRCGKGEYLQIGIGDHPPSCLPCPRGTCMTETGHLSTSFHRCDVSENDLVNAGEPRTSSYLPAQRWSLRMVVLCVILFHFLVT